MPLIEARAGRSLAGLSSANILLQILTLASKSLLLLGLARYLTPAEFGVFGLLVVTLNLSMYLIGLDFYAFNTRELLRREPEAAPALLRDQLVFHMVTYSALLPPLLLIFKWGVLPWTLALLFYCLLFAEHIGQELQRVLITMHRPVRAAVLFFLRGGLWVYALLGLMAWNPATRTVHTVVIVWTVGVVGGLIVAGRWMRNLPWRVGIQTPIDWKWLRRGAMVAIPFLGASLAFRGILSVDRFALAHFWGVEAVGVYTLYAGVRNAIQSILDMGVVAVLRPRIIRARQAGDLTLYNTLLRRMALTAGSIAIGLCVLAGIVIFPVLEFVGDPVYRQYLGAYWIMLGVTVVSALADIPHTALYARHRDRAILVSSVLGLGAAIVANIVLVPRHGLAGAALATLIASAVVGGLKAKLAQGDSMP